MSAPYPANQSAARAQHMNGNAEHWAACTGCGARDGEQCYNLSGAGVPRKKNPCAGRVWRSRS